MAGFGSTRKKYKLKIGVIMRGKLVYIHHKLESVSEYFFVREEQKVIERKTLNNHKEKLYTYAIDSFKKMNAASPVKECFSKLA